MPWSELGKMSQAVKLQPEDFNTAIPDPYPGGKEAAVAVESSFVQVS